VETKIKKLNPGCARVEFIKNIEEIKQMIIARYSLRSIHSKLLKEEKITMSYSSFYKIVNTKKSYSSFYKLVDINKSKSGE